MAYWIDDGFDGWPEVVRAGKAAAGLYICCGAWIARSIGNGNITEAVVPVEVATMYGTPEWVAKLILVGLWSTEAVGYRDVRYHAMGNPSAEVVARNRAQAARRQALTRNPALREAVRERDQDRCRYCGCAVRWPDRKGPRGGTYSHLDPFGANTFDNIVVACRGCSRQKGERTPAQAGMAVLAPGAYPDTTRKRSRSEPGRNLDSSPPPSLPPLRRAPRVRRHRRTTSRTPTGAG